MFEKYKTFELSGSGVPAIKPYKLMELRQNTYTLITHCFCFLLT